MDQIPLRGAGGDPPPLTRRAAAKAQTRTRVMEAARRLFAERGYEAATIRDIAAEAGLSTGAVFASFRDKTDLFNEVIITDVERFAAAVPPVDPASSTHDALLATFGAGYALNIDELSLIQAALGFSWQRDRASEARAREGEIHLIRQVEDILRRGVARGELSQTLDLRLVSSMLWASYIANYRQAIFDGWDVNALRSRMSDQIRLLLDGARAAA